MGFSFAPFLGGMAQQYNTITDANRVNKARLGELEIQHGYSMKQLKEQHKLALLKGDADAAHRISELIKQYGLAGENDKSLAELQHTHKMDELDKEYGLKEGLATHEGDIDALLDSDYTTWGAETLKKLGLPPIKLKTTFSEGELKGGTAYNHQLATINSWDNKSLKAINNEHQVEFQDLLSVVNGVFKNANSASIISSDVAKGYIQKNWLRGTNNMQNLEGIGDTLNAFIDEGIRGKELHDWRQRDGKYYDDVLITLSPDGKTFQSKPIIWNDVATSAGFTDKTAMFKAAEPLVGFGVNSGSKDSQDLAGFLRNMITNKVSLAALQLAPEIDFLQELAFDDIDEQTPSLYGSIAEKVNTINQNIITHAAETGGKPDLVDMEDIGYLIATTSSDTETKFGTALITSTNNTRDMKGSDWKYNDTDRQAQYNAALKTKTSVRRLKSNVKEMGSAVGLPSEWSQFIMKVQSTGEGFSNIITGFRTAVEEGKIVDTYGTMGSIFKQMEGFQQDANMQGDSENARNARLKAEQNFLKFSIAYQLSMALQGGSGGRTISDQDVANILQALNMDTLLQNPDLMISALDVIEDFTDGLMAMSKWSQTTVKGYRVATHMKELFYADGKPRSSEDFLQKFEDEGLSGERPDSIGTTFSKYKVTKDDLFSSSPKVKFAIYTDGNGNTHPVVYFGRDERFGQYSGKILVATSDMTREYLDAFYKNNRISESHQKDIYEPRFEMSSVGLDPKKEGLIKNPLTGTTSEILLQ